MTERETIRVTVAETSTDSPPLLDATQIHRDDLVKWMPVETQSQYLSALYQATYLEISRLRNYEWRITYYFILMSIGATGFLTRDDIRVHFNDYFRIVVIFIMVLSQCLGCYLRFQTHGWLTQQRNIRRTLEGLMGFYDDNIFAPLAVLPWKGKSVSRRFQTIDLIVPMVLGMTVVNLFSGIVIWLA